MRVPHGVFTLWASSLAIRVSATAAILNTNFDELEVGQPFELIWKSSTTPVDITFQRLDPSFFREEVVDNFNGTSTTFTPIGDYESGTYRFLIGEGNDGYPAPTFRWAGSEAGAVVSSSTSIAFSTTIDTAPTILDPVASPVATSIASSTTSALSSRTTLAIPSASIAQSTLKGSLIDSGTIQTRTLTSKSGADATSPPTSISSTSSSGEAGARTSRPKIIGVAVGCSIGGLAAVIGLGWFLFTLGKRAGRRTRRQSPVQGRGENIPEMDSGAKTWLELDGQARVKTPEHRGAAELMGDTRAVELDGRELRIGGEKYLGSSIVAATKPEK
ncbi:hypothetical protein F4778DRAFT_780138 [Xylariomycetidae sp. FL2044]|nr:hypothetical protein F4778DRAFT_780138 [Xylariomycetidae sp. FL2044]